MIRYISVIISLCISISIIAQTPAYPIPSLNDTFPDIVIGEFNDRPGSAIKLSQFKGKLIILDFWSVTCTRCITKMPLMDSLQRSFKDKIQVILVTYNSKNQVERLFSKVKIKKPDLPLIVGDTILNKLFPHNTVPHHVWIDKQGIIKYITDDKNANYKNIEAVLAGKQMNFRYKNEFSDFDRDALLWQEGGGRLNYHLIYYSLFMDQIDEFGGSSISVKIDSIARTMRIRVVNNRLIDLYKIAFSNAFSKEYLTTQYNNPTPDSRVLVEANETAISEDIVQSIFCYESFVMFKNPNLAYITMQEDLNRFFPYSGTIEKRKIKCWVLIDRIEARVKNSRPAEKRSKTESKAKTKIQLMTFLSGYFKTLSLKEPVVDGTKNGNDIDVTLDFAINGLENLRAQLSKYGMDIVLQDKEIDMLIIRKRD